MFTLTDALTALTDREEFLVKRVDNLVVLDYLIALPDSFAGLRRNFRGVTFYEPTGEIISLPLHKFYNVGQTEETQFHCLKNERATIYEKLDGSMIHFYVHPERGELLASTRKSSDTPQAQAALLVAKAKGMENRIRQSIDEGYTPVFEYVAANNQIVVEYLQSRLVYLISRHRETGTYRFEQDRYEDVAQTYEFNFGELHQNLDKEEFEGYVCHLSNGMVVKAKTAWYLERHRCVDAMMRPKYRMFEAVFNGSIDDMLPVAPDRYREALEDIYREAQADFLKESKRVLALGNACKKYALGDTERDRRKAYALHVQAHHKDDMSLLMLLYQGREITEPLQQRLLEGYKLKYPHRLLADLAEDA